jgi:hypothetical protein
MLRWWHAGPAFLGLLLGLGFDVAPAEAQTALTVGTMQKGTYSGGAAAVFSFTSEAAGLLSVAVGGDGDVSIVITDEDGQPLPEGTSDRDLNGSVGTEATSVQVPEAGRYSVRVTPLGTENGSFELGSTFLPFPALARASDPDGRPGIAQPLAIGAAKEDTLDPSAGDSWDWFLVTAEQGGTLVLMTRLAEGADGDLALEVFIDGDYTDPEQRSDRDLEGSSGNESVSISVTAGQTIHVKVSTVFTSGGSVAYRLSSGVLQ